MKCLDEKTVAEFVSGSLSRAERTRVEDHVDGCATCRRLIADEVKRSLFRSIPDGDAPTMVEGRHGLETAPTLRMMRKPSSDDIESPLMRQRFKPGMVIGHRYRLESHIASGGMAEVWRANDTQLDVPVAVKLLGESFADDAEVIARFQREAKAAARLRSPHVVAIQGLGVHEGTPYIAMELLVGEDLDVRLDRRGRLTLEETETILKQAARAIQRAHDEGIVHRDLKPSNVFLAQVDGREVVKILDFGIAKMTTALATGSLTRTGQVMGTLHYMSPEQAIGDRHVDLRSDLWSLAMIVFRMATGDLGVTGETVAESINKIVHGDVSQATSVAPDLPIELDGFFARAFAFSRDRRFQSAEELAREFSEIVASSETRRAVRRPSIPPFTPPPDLVLPAVRPTIVRRAAVRSRRVGTFALAIAGLVLVGALAAIFLVSKRDVEKPTPPVGQTPVEMEPKTEPIEESTPTPAPSVTEQAVAPTVRPAEPAVRSPTPLK